MAMRLDLETDHRQAWRSAHSAEGRYLAAVKQQASVADLADLATYTRDRWCAVSGICALGQDAARSRVEMPPIRHRLQALSQAWREARDWAALGEDAAARGELFGALACAHVPAPPTHEIIRLYADGVTEDSFDRSTVNSAR
jgi:hypothetical protein